jgi:hypothetical protein
MIHSVEGGTAGRILSCLYAILEGITFATKDMKQIILAFAGDS